MVRARKPRPPQMPGNPQSAYPQRTDLAAQPVRVPTGRGYGQAKAIEQAQRAAPLPQARPPVAPAPQINDPQARMVQAITDARGIEYDETPFNAPTSRPGEPITAGMSVGPGPGPEVLGFRRNTRAAAVLAQLAAESGDSELAMLAEMAELDGV